jgi:hypothetical protein
MAVELVEREWDAEAAGDMPERRWFALLSAIESMHSECAVLLEASKLADIAWRRACVQLAEFEAFRDALEEEISGKPVPPLPARQPRSLNYGLRSGFRGAGRG